MRTKRSGITLAAAPLAAAGTADNERNEGEAGSGAGLAAGAKEEHSPGSARLRLATAGRPPRAGKITRLPVEIREELNERLYEGELGAGVLAWLNGLPEARAVLETHFEGAEITKQNLSQWRHSGYRDWLAKREQREAIELMARGADRVKAVKGQLAEQPAPKLADVMALQRTLIFLLMSKAQTDPEMLAKVVRMAKPLLKYEELQTRIAKFDLVERKFRDQVAEREQALEAERKRTKGGNVISEETKRKIWRELEWYPDQEPGDSDQDGPNESEQVQAGPGEKEPISRKNKASKTAKKRNRRKRGTRGKQQSDPEVCRESAPAICEALVQAESPSESKQVQPGPGEKEPISETDVWHNLEPISW